jgi:glycosyltransferase involved in cell wall biosynthesis
MKVAIITPTFKPKLSGISEAVYDRAKVLSAVKDLEMLIFAPDYAPLARELPDYRKYTGRIFDRIRVQTYPTYEPKIKLEMMKRSDRCVIGPFWKYSIEKELARFNPDIIQVEEPEILFGMVVVDGYMRRVGIRYARRKGIPIIAMWHTDYYRYAQYSPSLQPVLPLFRFFFESTLRYVYNSYDHTLVSSREARKTLEGFGIRNVMPVDCLGVDRQLFKRRKLERDPSTVNLLYVGRIAVEKNVQLLFPAFERLTQKYPYLRLLIVGDGPSLRYYKKLYGMKSNIVFFGGQSHDRLPYYYSLGDIFINPSITETFGLVNIEAAASSLPIVAADGGGNRDTVVEGENGFLFRSDNGDDLVAKVARLVTDEKLRRRMAHASRRISERYDIKTVSMNVLKVWQELALQQRTKRRLGSIRPVRSIAS